MRYDKNRQRIVADFFDAVFFVITKIFSPIKFSPAFWGRRREPTAASVVLRRARNLISALFFLIAFSFAVAMAKEKEDRALIFSFGCILYFKFIW